MDSELGLDYSKLGRATRLHLNLTSGRRNESAARKGHPLIPDGWVPLIIGEVEVAVPKAAKGKFTHLTLDERLAGEATTRDSSTTNSALESYGFDSAERTRLLIGYGKDTVRNALALVSQYRTNVTKAEIFAAVDLLWHEEDVARILEKRKGLVARVQAYYTLNPLAVPKGNQEALKAAESRRYFIENYVFGNAVAPKPMQFKYGQTGTGFNSPLAEALSALRSN